MKSTFFYILHNLPPPRPPPEKAHKTICLGRWRKRGLEAVCLDHLLPRSLRLAVQSVIFFFNGTKRAISIICSGVTRKENYLEKEKLDFYRTPKCVSVKCVWLEMEGLCGAKVKPTEVVWRLFCLGRTRTVFAKAFDIVTTNNGNYPKKKQKKTFVLFRQKCWEWLWSEAGSTLISLSNRTPPTYLQF